VTVFLVKIFFKDMSRETYLLDRRRGQLLKHKTKNSYNTLLVRRLATTHTTTTTYNGLTQTEQQVAAQPKPGHSVEPSSYKLSSSTYQSYSLKFHVSHQIVRTTIKTKKRKTRSCYTLILLFSHSFDVFGIDTT
jgi:hypothetical protein